MIKEKIVYFLVALFFITLFLPDMPVLNNIAVGAILLHSFFYNSIAEKRQLFRQRKEIGFMLLFYLLHIVSALLSVNKQEAMNMLVLRLPLLLFPLSLGLLDIRPALKDRMLLGFAVITTLTALVCLGWAFGRYCVSHEAAWLYDDSLTTAIRRQSIYFALVVNLALFSFTYLLLKPSIALRRRWLAWGSICFLLVFQFMLASRIAIIILCLSLFAIIAIYLIRKRKFLEGAILAMGMLIGGAILMKTFPKTVNRFKELKYRNYTYKSHAIESHYNMDLTADQWNGANIRLAIWKCGWELAKKNWLAGVQLGDKQDKLMEVYRARNFDFATATRRNMHNNYLDILCCFGIIGLTLFFAGYLLIPLITCFKYGDGLGIFILLAFAGSMITETYFDRSIGCLLTGFFLSFVSACKVPAGKPAQ
jgi:O-antigen ligase